MTIAPRSWIATVFTLPILYLGAIEELPMIPSEYYKELPGPVQECNDWTSECANLPYQIDESAELSSKVHTLHRVVSELIAGSQELDAEIGAIINRRFWDLV